MNKTIVAHPNDLLSLPGKKLGPTETMRITQSRIDQFAEATDDHQWIHVDAERAAAGPFGKTIAHGYLTLSLASCFLPDLIEVQNTSMGVNYGTEKARFPSPVAVDSDIFATGEIISAEENKGGIKTVVRVTISVLGSDRPACIVDTISVFYP